MEELGGAPDVGLNTTNAGESTEITQEAIARVSENARRAAQAGRQVQDDQKKNSHLALFLEFLFNDVKSDEIREILVQLCTKPDSTGKTLTLALPELVAFFAPFYPQQMQELNVEDLIGALPHIEGQVSKEHYIGYMNILRGGNNFMQSMDKMTVAKLIVALLHYFGYVNDTEKNMHAVVAAIEQALV